MKNTTVFTKASGFVTYNDSAYNNSLVFKKISVGKRLSLAHRAHNAWLYGLTMGLYELQVTLHYENQSN